MKKSANANLIVSLYFLMKMLPIIVSGFCIYLGYKMFILGVTGQASISVQTETLGGQLFNAAPGLFFGTGGILNLTLSIIKGMDIGFADKDYIDMDLRNGA